MGTKKSHPASTFREGQTTTFLDLPVETRMQIYGYILDEDEPIELVMIRRRGQAYEIARGRNNRDKHHRGQIYDKGTKTWIAAPPGATAIMFVNQQVYAESTKALYGNNTFEFDTTTVLRDFLERLGKRSQFLRRIHIGTRFGASSGYVRSSIRDALKLLRQATGLNELHFHHYDFCTERYQGRAITPKQLVDDCGTLLKSVHASYQAQNLTANVLDVLQISTMTGLCFACRDYGTNHQEGVAKLAKETIELNASIRSLVAEKLGISET